MKLDNDFRCDITVAELIQFLEDKKERVLAKLDENEEYVWERLSAHDMSQEEFDTLEALTERYERIIHRYSDLIYGISRFAEDITYDCE